MPHSKLNILIVMPRFVKNVGEGYYFPLGIAYISSSLKAAGFSVFTLNPNHREGSLEDVIAAEIRKHRIDLLMTGCLSFQYIDVRRIIEFVKKEFPSVVTAPLLPFRVWSGVASGRPPGPSGRAGELVADVFQ